MILRWFLRFLLVLLAGLICIVALLAWIVFGMRDEKWSWNQKITVTVETPQGEKNASGVARYTLVKLDTTLLTAPPPGGIRSAYTAGEALMLEVSPGRYVFALLSSLPNPFQVFFPGELPEKVVGRLMRLREKRESARELYPMFVTFDDIADPASVKQVDPDDLDLAFGCETNSAGSAGLPWRAAGTTYRQWVKQETLRLAPERAAAAAGITGEAAIAIEEYNRLLNLGTADAARNEKRKELLKKFSGDQLGRWNLARNQLRDTIPATLPSAESYVAAAGGKTCYRIKSITLEITDEPVTKGKVEGVLPQSFFSAWGAIHRDALSRGILDPYFKSFLGNLYRSDFQRI